MDGQYFLYGYYGFGNFGDDLLLTALIAGIRQRDPSARFVVRAKCPVTTFVDDPGVEFLCIEDILEDRSRSRISRFIAYSRNLISVTRRCHTLVIGGGTLFIDKGRMNWSMLFLYLAVRAVRRSGGCVVVAGVAVDILTHPVSVWLVRAIGRHASFVAVRDAVSRNYFCTGPEPVLAADLAWLLALPTAVPPPSQARPVLVLNFIDYFRTSVDDPAGHQAYRTAIARLVARYASSHSLRFVAFQAAIGQRDDWVFEEFCDLYPAAERLVVNSLEGFATATSEAALVVTTRFHMALLAVRLGCKVCIVDHELKLTTLAQEMALPAIAMADFIAADGSDPVTAAVEPHPFGDHRQRYIARAALNFGWMTA